MNPPDIKRKRELLHPNDTANQIHVHRNCTIEGKKIELGKGKACDVFNNVEFIDCEIRLYSSGRETKGATLNSHFKSCYIWAHKIQNIPTWEASFDSCIFKGKYEARFPGIVKDCDFSLASFNSACFQQDEPLGNVKWPKYPHIVVSDAIKNFEDWSTIEKPKELSRFIVNPKTKGKVVLINLATAVNEPDIFWEVIKEKDYVSTVK